MATQFELKSVEYDRTNLFLHIVGSVDAFEKLVFEHKDKQTKKTITVESAERFITKSADEIKIRFNTVLGPDGMTILSNGLWKIKVFATNGKHYQLNVDEAVVKEAVELLHEYEEDPKLEEAYLRRSKAGKRKLLEVREEEIEELGPQYIRLPQLSKLFYKNTKSLYEVDFTYFIKNKKIRLVIIERVPEVPPTWLQARKNEFNKWKHDRRKDITVIAKNFTAWNFEAQNRLYSRLFKVKKNRILFTSDSRGTMTGNMEFVYKRMLKDGMDKQYDIRVVLKNGIETKRSFKDKIRLPFLLATSKVVIIDDFHPTVYSVPYKEEQNMLQLWHAAGAFKTVGYSRLGKPGGPDMRSVNHRMYDAAIVSSSYCIPFYAEAFGIPEENVFPTGVPRDDIFFDEAYKDNIIKKLNKEIPEIVGKTVIMFAPTFRGSGQSSATYPWPTVLDFPAMAEYARANNSVFLMKLHPFVNKFNVKIPKQYQDVLIDVFEYREVNDLLFVSDVLITDYSSVVFEFSIFNKPILFYAYDLDKYISSRDFYVNFEDFVPGKIVKTFPAMMKALEKGDFEQEKVAAFNDLWFEYKDNKSTQRVIDLIEDLSK